MKEPTVYVVMDMGSKDFSPALQYGQLEVLLSRDLPVFGDASPVINKLAAQLAQFDPLVDHVLPTGDPLAIGAVFAVLGRAGHPHIMTLKWDRQARIYRPVKIPILPRRANLDL